MTRKCIIFPFSQFGPGQCRETFIGLVAIGRRMVADNGDVKSPCSGREERIDDEVVKGALLDWAFVEVSGENPLLKYDEGKGRASKFVI